MTFHFLRLINFTSKLIIAFLDTIFRSTMLTIFLVCRSVWEFLSVINRALVVNTILGISVVTFIAFIMIPHWSAAVFIFPLICVLYVDLLGALQWAGKCIELFVLYFSNTQTNLHIFPWHASALQGVHINAVSYVTLGESVIVIINSCVFTHSLTSKRFFR